MGFNLGQIEKCIAECSGENLNADIVIEKILQMKPETPTTSKNKTSKMVLKPEWACGICTFVNINIDRTEGKVDECQICYTPAGEDAFLTEIFIEEYENTEEIMFANLDKNNENKYLKSDYIKRFFGVYICFTQIYKIWT